MQETDIESTVSFTNLSNRSTEFESMKLGKHFSSYSFIFMANFMVSIIIYTIPLELYKIRPVIITEA